MPTSLVTILALAVFLAVVLSALASRWSRAWQRRNASRRAQTRARHAVAGESVAEDLLAEAGFVVVDRQARTTWRFFCDDDPVDAELRCDLLVEQDGRLLVAEVKTGALAPRLDTAATRRQLLEYQLAYGAAGVVLVDADTGSVRVVDFPLPTLVDDEPRRAVGNTLTPLLIGVTVGAALMHWF